MQRACDSIQHTVIRSARSAFYCAEHGDRNAKFIREFLLRKAL